MRVTEDVKTVLIIGEQEKNIHNEVLKHKLYTFASSISLHQLYGKPCFVFQRRVKSTVALFILFQKKSIGELNQKSDLLA